MTRQEEHLGSQRGQRNARRSGLSRRPDCRRASGTILIVTIWILLALAGLVLVLGQAMRVEGSCSANETAELQADAIETGAIQYVLANVDSLVADTSLSLADIKCEAVKVGGGVFWIIRQDLENDQSYTFGLTDEGAKLNINANWVTSDVLVNLPGMTIELAAAIVDWRDTNNTPDPAGGAENEYYLMLADPYQCKDGPFETIEELLLVRDMTREILYGEDLNRNGVLDVNENDGNTTEPPDNADGLLDRGLSPYITVYSRDANGSPRINVNTAPSEVLACLVGLPGLTGLPGLNPSDVQAIVSARTGETNSNDPNWVAQVLGNSKYQGIGNFISTRSYQYSADIVSLAGNGRAFRRCRIVVDATATPSRVIYRQNLTHLGWPLDESILSALRAGKSVDEITGAIQITSESHQ